MSLPGIETHSLDCIAFDPQSRWLIAGGGAMTQRNGRSVTLRELIAWNIPDGDMRWQVVEEAKEIITNLATRPSVAELATSTGGISVWSVDGKSLRKFNTEFLSGPIAFSPDGKCFVAPTGNVLKIRDCDHGKTVASISIAKSSYTSAEAAAFVPGTSHLVVAASVINNKGQTSGKILLVDYKQEKVLKATNIDVDPRRIAIDPRSRWVCVAGQYHNRGCILFWNVESWQQIATQGAHGPIIDSLSVSPSGQRLASTGADHIIRLWDTESFKTVAKLDQHTAEGSATAGVAWSPDGQYIAFASGGAPPWGGVFLYALTMGQWKLVNAANAGDAPSGIRQSATDLRHLLVSGSDTTMDTVGNYSLPTNRWPVKCPRCTFSDIDGVPDPYLLSRGFAAPGDFSSAELGNFFVRERARHILETAAPDVCQFYPTFEAKSRKQTDWFLAVPQAKVQTAKLPEKYVKCPECGEPKMVSRLEPLPLTSPTADIFKSQQWTCLQIGEETAWYLESYLKTSRDKVSKTQWTRLFWDRELWFSSRLLLLMKELKVKGLNSSLANRKATPDEAAWIASQIERIGDQPTKKQTGNSKSKDSAKWLREYLKEHASKKPMATKQVIHDWEQKQKIKLPTGYTDFVTTVGRHSFADMFGEEGYSVRIVGPKDLDEKEYRRDPPENPLDDAEPDGLLFAVAINGDALCFDLRGHNQKYPVFHFDHETTRFEPFAADFASAIRRLVERE